MREDEGPASIQQPPKVGFKQLHPVLIEQPPYLLRLCIEVALPERAQQDVELCNDQTRDLAATTTATGGQDG